MLILLKRHWAAVIGWLNLLPVTLKGIWHLVGHAGDVDFFVAHLRERGWFFDMLAWALDPPSWAYLPMVALGVLLIIWDNRRNRMTSSAHPHAHVKVDNAKMSATGHMEWPGEQPASIFISSNNQSGGITAHTVFAKQPPRKLTREMKQMLLLDLPKEQSIGVAGLIGDSESIAFSLQIAEFLKSKGYHIPEDSSAQILMQGVPPIGLSLLPPDDMHEYYTVIVGTQPE